MRRFFLFFLFAVSMMAYGKKITDEALKDFCREASHVVLAAETEEAKQGAFDALASKWSKDYDVRQMTAEQVEFLFETGGLNIERYVRKWLEPTLLAKAEKDGAFAFLAWKRMPENDGFMHSPKETDALLRFLSVNDLQNQFDAHPDYAQEILASLATMKDANWHTAGFPEAIRRCLSCKLPELSVIECVKAFNSIARVDEIENEHRDGIRKLCLEQYQKLESALDNPRKKKMCQEQIKYLQGPFACGTLVGGKAPALHFLRAFKQVDDSIAVVEMKTMDDLVGKVVLLDFWGTKCVPCLQSFPEIAELQKHIDGKDVVVLGITSLQGYFVDTPNHRTIQCRNNPEKELGCFPAFMKGMGVNWHIGVTEEDVMNTDYGVLAIPHVTIIDKKGNVRYNAVNLDNEGKIKLIEELLAE